MTMPDELTLERAVTRITRLIAVFGGIGTLAAFAIWGWKAGAGFSLGAGISALSFWWLKRLVESLGPRSPKRRVGVLAFRYLMLGAGGYVILSFTSISLPAVLAGVFVLTAAVFTEVIVEITYARK